MDREFQLEESERGIYALKTALRFRTAMLSPLPFADLEEFEERRG
jgi:hypothetical protein